MRVLATKMFRMYKGMKEAFSLSHSLNQNTRFQHDVSTRPLKTVYHGTESLGYLVPKICLLVPAHLKNAESTMMDVIFENF